MNSVIYAIVALVLWNLVTFLMMGFDKHQAKKGGWRIPEKRLFLSSFLFGGMGIALGMSIFRHKTKHLSFVILVPLSVLADGILVCGILWYLQPWK